MDHFLPLLLLLTSSVNGFFHPPNIVQINPERYNGEPLFLTPLLEKGMVDEARNLSKVAPLVGAVRSFSGYLTVDQKYNSNLFFWFFPAEVKPESAPVAVWLQGGPGATSLYGLFEEHGPFQVDDKLKLSRRKFTWTKTISMIYIDNPVGTGYSFTDNDGGYCKNETEIGKNLYNAVTQFFLLFPELQKNDFYVAGESYGGKYAPILAYEIHDQNQKGSVKINLKGIAIGNGFSDPVHMLNYGEYLYQHGFIDTNAKDVFDKARDDAVKLINGEKYYDAFVLWDKLLDSDLTNSTSVFTNLTGFTNYFNYLVPKAAFLDATASVVQKDYVREKIHVGNQPFHGGKKVETNMANDIMKSVAPQVEVLIDNYKFMVYNGQLDIIVAYPLTVDFIKNLKWSGAEQYKTASRKIWRVNNDIAGYVKIVNHFCEVLVRNAGHMVPADQPAFAYDLITRFIFEKSFV